jgi:Tol biopolymer transport system component/DNA-binding winged helix-turn-helix (wHTH) protein
MANHTTNDVFEFGSWRLDAGQRALAHRNERIPLTPKTFDLLLMLVRSPARAFSRHELMAELWPDTIVEEANLSYQISLLRKALGEDGRWIETVQKHGYRFSAAVNVVPAGGHVPPDSRLRGVESGAEATSPRVTTPHRRRFLLWSGVAAASLALGAYLLIRQGRPASPRERVDALPVPLTAYPGWETEPSLSPDGSQVAFVWNGPRQDNFDIYVKLVGPGEPLRLTTSPRDDDSPAWSPDGRTIAFLRAREISDWGARTAVQGEVFVIPALGGAERRIATMSVPPHRQYRELSWSPDGKWLLVGGAPHANEPFGLWLLEVNGSERRRLTSGSAQTWQFDAAPQFSPDGHRIAFIRVGVGSHALFTLSLSPALTPAGPSVQMKTDRGQELGDLAWSPDGTRLFYSAGGHAAPKRLRVVPMSAAAAPGSVPQLLSFGDGATTITVGHTGRVVYSAEFTDTNLWRLDLSRHDSAPEDAGIPQSTLAEHMVAYSSDGKRVAFSSTRSGSEELWIANVDGTGLRQVTSTGGPVCSNPQWSPDDRVIVFDSAREGSRDLYLLTPDTLELRRLTQDPAAELEPYWSRDGRWIYFGSDRTGQFETWKMRREGGAAIQVTRHGGIDAQESPDGRFLYFATLNIPVTLWRMPIGGGDAVQIADRLTYPRNFVVSTAGIYLVAPGDRPNTMSIDFLDARTGRRSTRAKIDKDWESGLALSPDQRWLLFSVVERAGADLMSVDTTP